ncbi:MAG: Phosphate regulon sensor protein PhoR (SphS) [Chloroflexi bacterium AL-W]|nr:Phosphate regulon sensor protein PhoR (SphS) [Chloroflexi bacterium AL-N1]NOK68801.1 Phosphate regulon sensor protein PhoR (SphS) [Chloroflexi bacterium AL-N10]NOK76287.1 Phosphate regulon sensor protein PhoR (SphS) [Chloroflexi bacterium AL-N5]NOK84076.1 Phosphate regulon sensor protein PhoR (SphS) [Chloroflexi bacterium AL-W]NOK91425.1 Phosphate regulon sensor protein PhoR (SphS) [Chloroflexi bacterium AL-N15]
MLVWQGLRRQHNVSTTHQELWFMWDKFPFGIVITSPENTVLFANVMAQRLFAELGSASPDILTQTIHRLGNATQITTPRNGIISHPLPLRWWRYPIDNQGSLLVITDGREQQRFIQEQQTFISQLSHELRTPLTALVAHTEIIRNPQTTDVVRHASTETIQRETQRMARLVRDLLELYRLETTADLPLQPVNLVLITEEAIAQVFPIAEEHQLIISFNADTRLPLVLAQPDRLKQVFLNVLDNAIKYCRPEDTILIQLEAATDSAVCIVRDSGPGISAMALPRVTERLYRGHEQVEGSGLGLALVEEILRQHNTKLSIESKTTGNSGTTVSWTLDYAPKAGK